MPRDLPNLKKHKGQFAFRADLDDPAVYGTIEKFLIWCKRESMTFEQGLLIVISEGVDRHYYGNTQTLLASYEEDGKKSEGQQEKELVEYYMSRDKDGYNVKYSNIGSSLRERLGYKGSKLISATERLAKLLHENGIKIWR